ncbi:Nonribosomal peptide synthetase 3-2 [Frankia canadensis]|uniref:Nonribosomal peptide synthetase 3-2 n=1 Tax=Frankia canadensis TaxID=1836972 RepID=A0A2I2KI86_9ACTN|nr:non-ribosomal peptide synthetase [Frankia canadensis]SNQ45381.1 Nonribosomal peptide synthetase 3-2 [Frankia canadensis]SOU52671.1 Nonribosomal peptide synthetase 3-2 [Frankia canadensis]
MTVPAATPEWERVVAQIPARQSGPMAAFDLGTVAVAAVAALVHRYHDRDDVTVPLSVRVGARCDDCSVSTAIDAATTFAELVEQVALVERVARPQPTPPAGRPLGSGDLDLACTLADRTDLGPPPGWRGDVHLLLVPGDSTVELTVAHRRAQVAPSEATALIGHYERLLAVALSAPTSAVADAALLSPAEVHIQEAWLEGTAVDLPADATMHGLFERQARRSPDRLAAVCPAERVTYGELGRRADRTAAALRAAGVRRGDVVAVAVARSCALLVATLGVLKAGGVFMLVDVTQAATRRERLLDLSGARAIVTAPETAGAIAPGAHRTIVTVASSSNGHEDMPPLDITGTDPAYLTFTSGSSGEPKGVLIRHESFVNRQLWLIENRQLGSDDVSLQRTAVSFDPAICEMFRLLPVGGRVCFLPAGAERDPALVTDAIERHGVTIVDLVPSPLIALLEYAEAAGRAGAVSSLRWVLAGAETLDPWVAERFDELLGRRSGTRLVNGWGATEVTVDVTAFVCTGTPSGRRVPVGRPIDNVGVAVLDRRGRFMPIGAAGELHAGGRCLAARYLDPELTARRFVTRPAGGTRRLYRSGDRARWRPDDQLEFLGRFDDRLKIRGTRFEPGEIEAALRAHRAVRGAVVRAIPARPDADADEHDGRTRVAAFVTVAVGADAPDVTALRATVRAAVGASLVPDEIHVVAELPVTAHDKLDVDALAVIAASRRTRVHARTDVDASPTERTVTEIWQELLGPIDLPPDADVFDRGADSLSAARFAARLLGRHGVDLRVSAVLDNPTVRGLAALIESHQRGDQPDAGPQIVPVADAASYPASHSQRRHWIVSQFDGASEAYHVVAALAVPGSVDTAGLSAAVADLVGRHEILRTTFHLEDGELRQRVAATGAVTLTVHPDGATRDVLEQAGRAPFDLARGPLLRVGLIRPDRRSRGGADESIVYLAAHHIVMDGWSLSIFFGELFERARAHARGDAGPLPPPPLQYRDFAVWEQHMLASAAGERSRRFWRRELAPTLAPLSLPLDAPRRPDRSHRVGTVRFEVSAAATRRLRELARAEQATLFGVLLTAVYSWLHALTRQRDIVVGTPVAGRRRVELEDLLGSLVNSLPLRARLDPSETGRQLLRTVRDVVGRALDHDAYPLDLLVSELAPERAPARSPLFDVMLVLQNVPGMAVEPAVEVTGARVLDVDARMGKLDMIVTFTEHDGGLRGEIEHDRDLFTPARVVMKCELLQATLERLSRNADVSVDALDALDATVTEVVATTAPQSPGLLHEHVEAAARRSPDRPALTCAGRTATYRELDARATRLARHLRHRYGVGPEHIVATALHRSEWMVIVQLAILKAGGAFLGIDPNDPPERRRFILDDSRPSVVVVERRHDAAAAGAGARAVLVLDDVVDIVLADDGDRPGPMPRINRPSDLAYVIYTSGTTGRPKAVLVEHGNIVSLLRVAGERLTLGEDDVWTLFHSIGFDFSVWETYVPLSRGAHLVVVPTDATRDPRLLVTLLEQHRVSVLCQVPTVFEGVAPELIRRPAAGESLRYLIFGGEQVNPLRIREFLARHPDCHVVNGYGVTEATIFSSFHVTSGLPGPDDEAGNVGRPLGNQRLDVVDELGAPVGPGVIGEIVVCGASVARGYLGRPEATASAFGTAAGPGREVRSYRTGDLAWRTPLGELVHAGRADRQVKVRGFRVELDGIREVMLSTGLLTRDVAVTVTDGSGPTIVAFLRPDDAGCVDELRRRLHELLPDYMVPGRFVVAPDWPLAPSGKVDVRALAALDAEPSAPASAPTGDDDVAGVVQEVCRSLLGRQDLGADDDFFAAGGHSLLAVVLVARIDEALGVTMTVEDVFTHPRLGDLAHAVRVRSGREAAPAAAAGHDLVAMTLPARHHPVSPLQHEIWLLEQYRDPASPRTAEVIDLGTPWDPAIAEATFADLVAGFEVLRTTFPLVDGQPRQRVHSDGTGISVLAFSDLSDRADAGAELQALQEHDEHQPLSVTSGPLLRLRVVRMPPDRTVGLLVAHHIVWDGESFDVFASAWRRRFAARREGAGPLAPPRRQFRDFAAWHAAWSGTERGASDVEWWAGTLRGLPPGDAAGPHSFAGWRTGARVDAALAAGLRGVCSDASATLFMGLHAAVAVFHFVTTGEPDVAVCSPVSLRGLATLDGQLGPHLNMVTVRDRIDPAGSFAELIGSVRGRAIDAFDRRLTPPGDIARRLGRPADRPLAQVGLTLQSQERAAWLAGLTRPATAVDDAHTPLWFDVREDSAGLSVELTAQRSTCDEQEVRDLAELFVALLRRFVERPAAPISEIAAERWSGARHLPIDLDL